MSSIVQRLATPIVQVTSNIVCGKQLCVRDSIKRLKEIDISDHDRLLVLYR